MIANPNQVDIWITEPSQKKGIEQQTQKTALKGKRAWYSVKQRIDVQSSSATNLKSSEGKHRRKYMQKALKEQSLSLTLVSVKEWKNDTSRK